MKRLFRFLLILCVSCFCLPLVAQSVAPKESATVTFEFNWPVANPASYQISIDSSGQAFYQSTLEHGEGNAQNDPYLLKFTADPTDSNLIFRLAKELKYFQGDFASHQKNVAHTGTKTLRYESGSISSHTSYDATSNPKLVQLTALFQRMSETFEFGRKLEDGLRFDKLGLDAILKRMEEMKRDSQLAEVQAIAPILERISRDSGVMDLARQRARRLLESDTQIR